MYIFEIRSVIGIYILYIIIVRVTCLSLWFRNHRFTKRVSVFQCPELKFSFIRPEDGDLNRKFGASTNNKYFIKVK